MGSSHQQATMGSDTKLRIERGGRAEPKARTHMGGVALNSNYIMNNVYIYS